MDDLRAKLEHRREVYRAKRERFDPFEDDTVTRWEKYDFAAEVIEYMASDLGVDLPDIDDRR